MIDANKLKLYAGRICPVTPDTKVVYRVVSPLGHISHVHMGVRANQLNWGPSGRIYDYGIVK